MKCKSYYIGDSRHGIIFVYYLHIYNLRLKFIFNTKILYRQNKIFTTHSQKYKHYKFESKAALDYLNRQFSKIKIKKKRNGNGKPVFDTVHFNHLLLIIINL